MELVDFCRAHGIIMNSLPPIGVWRRYPTEDHPKKRNGAVKFMGDHAFVQNHATDTEISLWKTDAPVRIDHERIKREAARQERIREAKARDAAAKAASILKGSVRGYHPYLKSKGFEDEMVNIHVVPGDDQYAVIPMRINGRLVGVQLIDSQGGKKFLYGQRTSGAEFVFDNKGPHYFCEGYATGLSLRAVLASMKLRYTIHVCFSAGNMLKCSRSLQAPGLMIADNDASGTGERIARESGRAFWMSDRVGEDFNDYWRRVGAVRAALNLRPLVPLSR